MTECQGCGAWNDASRVFCVLCATPLAETDEWDAAAELPPLPSLPDGGLRASMPTWLRDPPTTPSPPFPPPSEASPPYPSSPPLGPRADPRTFLADDDFPRWLRDLAARRNEVAPRASQTADTPPHPATATVEIVAPAGGTSWSRLAASGPASANADSGATLVAPVMAAPAPAAPPTPGPEAAPAPVARPATAVVTARALDERRGREPWETLLLVLLVLGVLVAALWALVANGVFSPGL